MKKPGLIRTFLVVLQVIAGAALILSLFSPMVSPGIFWPMAFLGLSYPFLLAANAVLLLIWALRRDAIFLASVVVFIIGCTPLQHFFQWSGKPAEPVAVKATFKVMSYNVRLFDFYNWTNRKETKDHILNLVREETPDILCYQEFFTQDTGRHITREEVIRASGKAKHAHIEYTSFIPKQLQRFGIATLSAFPIAGKGKITLDENSHNICIYTDLVINHDTIRVYNMHLQSVRLLAEDYRFLRNPGEGDNEKGMQESRRIASKLKKAFIRRAGQVDRIKAHMQACPYPLIVCGDFNDSPVSYAYRKMAENLSDSYLERGTGWGRTYDGFFPGIRIDYILHSTPQITTENFRIIEQKHSDHFPITAYLALPKAN